jgi:hypothetical protein
MVGSEFGGSGVILAEAFNEPLVPSACFDVAFEDRFGRFAVRCGVSILAEPAVVELFPAPISASSSL